MFYAYTRRTTPTPGSVQSRDFTLLAPTNTRTLRIASDWLLISPTNGGWCVLTDEEYKSCECILKGISNGINFNGYNSILSHFSRCGLLGDTTQDMASCTPRRFSLTLMLSERCTLACKYCYLGMQTKPYGADLDPGIAREAIKAAFQQPTDEILIDFGEIALNYRLFHELVLYAKGVREQYPSKSLLLAIQTNGIALKPEVIDFLEKHRIIVGVSLDGPRRMHDQVRPLLSGVGSHQQVETGLREIIRREIPHIVLCTVSAANVNHVFEILNYFLDIDVWHFSFKPVIKRGNAESKWDLLGIDTEQFCDFLDGVVEYAIVNHTWDALDDRIIKFIFRLLRDPRGWSDYCPTAECGCGTQMVVVNPSGAFYPCPRFTSLSGNNFQLGDSWPQAVCNAVKLPTFSYARHIPHQCKSCVWWSFCRSGCQLARWKSAEEDNLDPNCDIYRHLYKLIVSEVLPKIGRPDYPGAKKLGQIEVVNQPMFG